MLHDKLLQKVKSAFAEVGVSGLAPRPAIIAQDCRKPEVRADDLSNHVGIYLGNFYVPRILDLSLGEPDDSALLGDALSGAAEVDDPASLRIANPLILGDNGELIWGHECWWGTIDGNMEKALRSMAAGLGIAVGSEIDEDLLLHRLRERLRTELESR